VTKTIFIASDHAGYSIKQLIIENCHVVDLGTDLHNISVDYNDFAEKVVSSILESDGIGILICQTGIGMSIAANRHKGIRASLCNNVETAKIAREHNNANVLVLSKNSINVLEIVKIFLETDFSGEERHMRRVKKLG
jgi:ribose 5-phosphate isomerase B